LEHRAVTHDERRRILSVVTATGIAFGMTYPYVPLLARDLGASSLLAGVVSGANVPAMLVVDGLGTRALARVDSRALLVTALISFGVGSAIATSAPNLAVLFGSRVFEGAGIAMFMTGGIHLVSRQSPVTERGRDIGRFNACWFLGAAGGPLLGGALAGLADGAAGLRIAFGVCAALSLASAVLAALMLPSYRGLGGAHLSLPPLRSLAGEPRLRRTVLLGGLSEAVRDGFMMVVIPLAAAAAGLADVAVGITLTLLALADVVSMLVSGHLADRYGRLRPLFVSLVVAAGVSLAGVRADSVATFCVLAVCLGLTLGTFWVVPPAMVLDLASDHEAAVTGYRLAADVGLFVGAAGGGALLEIVGSKTAFAGMAVILLLGALLTASIGETRQRLAPVPTLDPTLEATS
jgi:MFS family permease